MTAKEARELSRKPGCTYNMESVYSWIDFNIKQEAENGKSSCYVTVDGCDESWETVYYKREEIKEHYTELGFDVECLGYDRCITADKFIIKW